MRDPGDDEPTEAIGPVPAEPDRTEVLPAVGAWTPVPPPPRRAAPEGAPSDFPPPAPGAMPRFAAPDPGWGPTTAAPAGPPAGPSARPGAPVRYGWGQEPSPAQGRPHFDPPAGAVPGSPWGTPPAAVPPPAGLGWDAPPPGWAAPPPGWDAPPQGWAAPPQGWAAPQGWSAPPGWGPPAGPPAHLGATPVWGAPLPAGWAPARPTRDDLVWAPAAHWLPLLTHWVGPLAVLLTAGRRSERVRAEAVASLNWEITVAILLAVATALAPFGLVAPVMALATVAVSVGLHVFGAVTVARGGRFRYPLALPFVP